MAADLRRAACIFRGRHANHFHPGAAFVTFLKTAADRILTWPQEFREAAVHDRHTRRVCVSAAVKLRPDSIRIDRVEKYCVSTMFLPARRCSGASRPVGPRHARQPRGSHSRKAPRTRTRHPRRRAVPATRPSRRRKRRGPSIPNTRPARHPSERSAHAPLRIKIGTLCR